MLDLTWWQVLALVGSGVISVVGGRMAGGAIHRALYRRVLLTRSRVDDRFILRLEAPFEAGGIVLVWQVLVSLMDLAPGALAFCRNVGHIGLLLALGFAAMRTVDTGVEVISQRSRWIADQRISKQLLPLARRIVKIVLATLFGVMVLSRMGYATGPLLVLIAIIGGCFALAAHRPLENIISAFAMIGDHGIREGDHVTLENGVTGVIEQVGLYSTRLRTASSSFIIVPNRKLADAQIERAFQRPQTRPLGVVPAAGGQ